MSPDKKWTPREALDFLSVGDELEAWLHDRRTYESRHKTGWLSVIDEFVQSAKQIGPKLAAELSNELSQAITRAESLKGDLQNRANDEARLQSLLQARLAGDRAAYVQLKRKCAEPAAREAAWLDLQAGCRAAASSHESLAGRRDLFWHLVEIAGYSLDQMSRILSGVLADSAYHVMEARVWLGEIANPETPFPRPLEAAGLNVAEQLDLCRRTLTKSPQRADHIVWIAFNHAGSGHRPVKMGPVSFWDSQVVRSILEHEVSANLSELPEELRVKDGFFRFQDLPEDKHVVLVRVDLGQGTFTNPVRIAAEQAEAVVALASFRFGEDRWRQIQGYLDFRDGRLWSYSQFMEPVDMSDLTDPRYPGFIFGELERLAPRLEKHLLIAAPDFTEVAQAVRWWQQARGQTPLAAVLLHVRVLELMATRVGISWDQYIERYLRQTWVRNKMLDRLGQVVDAAAFAEEKLTSHEHREKVAGYQSTIISWNRDGTFNTNLKAGLGALPDFAAMFPDRTTLGRQIKSLDRQVRSPAALQAWCSQLERQWQLLSGRLQRLRNSLAHGGPAQDHIAESVQAFGERLAAWSLSIALEGLIEKKPIQVAHDEHEQANGKWRDSFASAQSVAEMIFG